MEIYEVIFIFLVGYVIGGMSYALVTKEKIRITEESIQAYRELTKKYIKQISDYEKAEKQRNQA